MARTYRNTADYIRHPGDSSHKGLKRQANKKMRKDTRQGLRKGHEALPVLRHQMDTLAH